MTVFTLTNNPRLNLLRQHTHKLFLSECLSLSLWLLQARAKATTSNQVICMLSVPFHRVILSLFLPFCLSFSLDLSFLLFFSLLSLFSLSPFHSLLFLFCLSAFMTPSPPCFFYVTQTLTNTHSYYIIASIASVVVLTTDAKGEHAAHV